MKGALYCFFCGKTLVEQGGSPEPTFACPGCQAGFRGHRDKEGCIVRMEVHSTCGAEDCCQKKRRASST